MLYYIVLVFLVTVASGEEAPECNLRSVFKTPEEIRKTHYDKLEIIEKNCRDPIEQGIPIQEELKDVPKTFANAQVSLKIGDQKNMFYHPYPAPYYCGYPPYVPPNYFYYPPPPPPPVGFPYLFKDSQEKPKETVVEKETITVVKNVPVASPTVLPQVVITTKDIKEEIELKKDPSIMNDKDGAIVEVVETTVVLDDNNSVPEIALLPLTGTQKAQEIPIITELPAPELQPLTGTQKAQEIPIITELPAPELLPLQSVPQVREIVVDIPQPKVAPEIPIITELPQPELAGLPEKVQEEIKLLPLSPEAEIVEPYPVPGLPELLPVVQESAQKKEELNEIPITKITNSLHPEVFPEVVLNLDELKSSTPKVAEVPSAAKNISEDLKHSLALVICSSCNSEPKLVVTYPVVHFSNASKEAESIKVEGCGCAKIQDEDRLYRYNGEVEFCPCASCSKYRGRGFVKDLDDLLMYVPPAPLIIEPPRIMYQEASSSYGRSVYEDPRRIVVCTKPKTYSYVFADSNKPEIVKEAFQPPATIQIVSKPRCERYEVIPRYNIVPRFDINPSQVDDVVSIKKPECQACSKYTKELNDY
ncbi:titin-like [Aethina tumida]|uniref:titin-like n=1 Tax=Aethina tumida TaxID=116153 RepID=UPI0021477BD0|nr:titin-like [Aethina tumida]